MELYACRIPNKIDSEKYNKLMLFIDDKRKERIERFHKKMDAYRSLIADILIRFVICNKNKINNEQITFHCNQYGKPYVRNFEGFHFNLSHSGEWIVCVFDASIVGIDIELIKSIDLKIAKRFFTKEEFEYIINVERKESLVRFYELWTLKESYIKAIGKGLSIPLDSFLIKKDNNEIKLNNEKNEWFFKQYEIDSYYKLSVCATHNKFPKNIIIKNLDDLYNSLI